MRWPNQPGIDDTFLEDLLLPESSRSGVKLSSQDPRLPMDLPRKRGSRRNKATDYPINSPATVVRQALFPSGPGSYPSQITPLNKPSESRQHKSTRQQNDNWAFGLSNEHKWREMGWNTSSPAEYVLQTNSKDYMLTLAYSEDLMHRQGGLASTDANGAGKSPVKTTKGGNFTRSPSFSNTTTTATTRGIAEVGSAQTEEERTLLKNAMLREGLLAKLHSLVKDATPAQSLLQPNLPPKEPVFNVSKGTEVLHLLLQLRDVGVLVLESILRWHGLRVRLAPMVPLVPFRFENHNYCSKMLTDLNFLSTIKTLGTVLGINPSTMKQNPFMMPAPIPERDFRGLRDQPWRSLRLFSTKGDAVQRVADAEKYLVWCLFNLQDAPAPASPSRSSYGNNSPTSFSIRKREQQQKVTWQKRAEKQLEMLSMPLESLSGPTYLQDSSKMMKRKGVLPSLPQSPPKNLRELMGNVQLSGGEEEPYDHCDNNQSKILLVRWSGEEFSATSADCEALGALEAPPHHMVTLVAASVLILLSPADQLPKDLSWPSCQKMLQRGKRLIQRVRGFDIAGVPAFKWKALVPFLQNEHFQPTFLAQYSCAASAMCAWVFSVLRAAQQQDYKRMGVHTRDGLDAVGEEDRLELLSELEVEASSPQSRGSPTRAEEMLLPPLTHSRSGKRVSIGNAEVLFINENHPVIMTTSRSSSRSSSRRGESPVTTKKSRFTISSLHNSGESNALLRTSPWTYRGVVYFVSFFIQQNKERSQQQQEDEEAEDSDGRRLMIKMYEPMSSVESQMSVDRDDLRQDFGEEALVAFQNGQYRTLCDVMLRQLDRMMGADSSKCAPPTPPQLDGGTSRCQVSSVDLLLQDESEEDRPEAVDEATEESPPEFQAGEEDIDFEASILKIQCAARQQLARAKVIRVRAQKEHEEASVVRIQCVARQKQARGKVDRVRADKKRIGTVPETEELNGHTAVEESTLQEVEIPESRPGTVMSYTSDQFENEAYE
ncbi:Dynein heavy chain 17 [Phytophthora citrophthora]|uniref:Dynein heavy chain 17 n=1 Tax=Phytophthora citrophthora TaxID=4793 RepID=A0AAD9GZ44_9STRA|nr:Dynein heavy chain 17 [Phytophthora citrophthora]